MTPALLLAAAAASAQVPSSPGWGSVPDSKLQSVCASSSQFPGIDGATGCNSVLIAWNSGAFDTKRNRLILWGGGHNDYYGNELYALDLNSLKMLRLTDPGMPAAPVSSCQETQGPGGSQPNTRHNYGGIAYIEHLDQLYVVSGVLACNAAATSVATWVFDFASMQWRRRADIPVPAGWTARQLEGTTAAYDPVSRLVFVDNLFGLLAYDPAADTYTPLYQPTGGYYGRPQNQTLIVDPARRYVFSIGSGKVFRWDVSDLSSVPAPAAVTTTGGDALVAGYAPGVAWDSSRKELVGWSGGGTVYRFNSQTNAWTPAAFAGGPGAAHGNGTYRRFAYSPASDLFVLVKDWAQDAAVLKLSAGAPPQTSPLSDFQARCAAPGVLLCQGWDDPAALTPAVWPDSGIYPGDDGQFHGGFDQQFKASGAGSLRLDILSGSSSNGPGDWRQKFGRDFGQNSTFYIQFRQRFSSSMIDINWYRDMGTSWKQMILYNMGAPSCSDFGFVTAQYYDSKIPIMYTQCGARGLWTNNGIPPTLLQQGDYNCPYGSESDPLKCFHYPAEEWVTFYYRFSVGTWGSANSAIEAWVAREGQPFKKWISMPNFTIVNSGNALPYNVIALNAYMTAKDASVAHADASTWFDELIVSTSPIAAPGAGPNPAPAAPRRLALR